MKDSIEYCNTETLAEKLGVCPETVRRWARAKMIPCYRIGGKWRFCLPEVMAACARMAEQSARDS